MEWEKKGQNTEHSSVGVDSKNLKEGFNTQTQIYLLTYAQ